MRCCHHLIHQHAVSPPSYVPTHSVTTVLCTDGIESSFHLDRLLLRPLNCFVITMSDPLLDRLEITCGRRGSPPLSCCHSLTGPRCRYASSRATCTGYTKRKSCVKRCEERGEEIWTDSRYGTSSPMSTAADGILGLLSTTDIEILASNK